MKLGSFGEGLRPESMDIIITSGSAETLGKYVPSMSRFTGWYSNGSIGEARKEV